jgi:hypothetical protein
MPSGAWSVTCSTLPAGEAHRLASPDVAWSTPSSTKPARAASGATCPATSAPRGDIWQQFRWRASGVWEKALTLLRPAARTKAARDPEPSMAMLDCQTVKGGRRSGFPRGGRQGRRHPRRQAHRAHRLPRLARGRPGGLRPGGLRPHDSKAGRTLLDDSMPDLPPVGEVLADPGFEPLVKGVQRRHKVTVTIRG